MCSATCGGGSQRKERSCNNPQPRFGGKDCVGEIVMTRKCGTDPCPGTAFV